MTEESSSVPSSIARVSAIRSDRGKTLESVIVEEPLEIRVAQGEEESRIAITMRTPGNDLELAVGFLLSEGLISGKNDVIKARICGDRSLTPRQRSNVVIVEVSPDLPPPARVLDRRFTISSACGVCGSTSLSDLHERGVVRVAVPPRTFEEEVALIESLKPHQRLFAKTGALHGVALVDERALLRFVREDVGRHNAVDKAIGAALLEGIDPAGWSLLLSGRVGFEIVAKAVVAGISTIVAVSAPTSLAIELATEFGVRVIGFAREGRGTQYC